MQSLDLYLEAKLKTRCQLGNRCQALHLEQLRLRRLPSQQALSAIKVLRTRNPHRVCKHISYHWILSLMISSKHSFTLTVTVVCNCCSVLTSSNCMLCGSTCRCVGAVTGDVMLTVDSSVWKRRDAEAIYITSSCSIDWCDAHCCLSHWCNVRLS